MPRGVFISYQHLNRNQAKGFRLMHYSRNVDLEFRSRHLLDPVKSTNPMYIWRRIRAQLRGSSVTVVLLGRKTHESKWVAREVRESIRRGNGIVAIRLKDEPAPLPPNSALTGLLNEAGAQVMDWEPHEMSAAIEQAALTAGRAPLIAQSARLATASSTSGGGSLGGSCNR